MKPRAAPKDVIAAAKVILEFSVARPTESLVVFDGAKAGLTVETTDPRERILAAISAARLIGATASQPEIVSSAVLTPDAVIDPEHGSN